MMMIIEDKSYNCTVLFDVFGNTIVIQLMKILIINFHYQGYEIVSYCRTKILLPLNDLALLIDHASYCSHGHG